MFLIVGQASACGGLQPACSAAANVITGQRLALAASFLAAQEPAALRHLKAGADHLHRGEHVQAISELKRAVALDPKSAAAHMLLGQAYLAGRSAEMISEAKAELQQALDIDPSLFWARFYLAKIHLDVGRPDAAKRELERADAARPNVPHILSLLGEVKRQLGDPRAAVELNERALAADPAFSPAHYYAALAYLDQGQEPQAVKALEAALESKHVIPEMPVTLAAVYMRRGDLNKAETLLQRAAAMDPARTETRLKTGELMRLRRRFDAALEELKLAMPQPGRALNTAYSQQLAADVLYETGRVYEDRGDTRAARDAYERSLSVLPEHPGARERLGRLK